MILDGLKLPCGCVRAAGLVGSQAMAGGATSSDGVAWTWKLSPSSVDVTAVVLTHAHLDHSGYVPLLARQGFDGPVYCTPATFDLCRLLLADSGHLLEEEAQYLNEHQLSKHHPALPLYTREDAGVIDG